MHQKCPNCGEWCYAEVRTFKEKAEDASDKVFEKGAEIGSRIGGLFGKKGENLGRKIGFMGSSYKALANSVIGGLSESDCHFICKCGYEWDANEDEDQSSELQDEENNLVGDIANLVNSLESEDDYDRVIELCKELGCHDYCLSLYWAAKAQFCLSNVYRKLWSSTRENDGDKANEYYDEIDQWLSRAYNTINKSIELYIEDIDFYMEKDGGYALDWAYNLKAWIEQYSAGDVDAQTSARASFIEAMNTEFEDVREDAIEGYELATNHMFSYFNLFITIKEDVADLVSTGNEDDIKFAEEMSAEAEKCKFSNLPYNKRQFVFITKEGPASLAGCTDPEGNIRYVFTLDSIPNELTFPVGHPQQNTLYVANPAQKGQYVPYKGAEDKLFHDKVNDFIRLSQCLGATEISFHSIKGESISQSFLSSTNVSGGVNVKGNSVTGEYGIKNTGNSSYNSSKEVELTRRYDPIKKPYCPDDVEWLSLDPEWQKFVKQRLEGNILESSMRISSSESICSNTNTLRNVKAAFENMMVKVDANYDSEEDNTFSSSESTEWQISVKFRSIRDFTEQCPLPSQQVSSLQLSPAEEKYKEEILFMLEDGVIGDAERRLLERKRQKFGVSEERAKLIEEGCAPSLSEEEKEYIEIYKDVLEDGEISERRRKILKKEAESLGISQSRAKELEEMI